MMARQHNNPNLLTLGQDQTVTIHGSVASINPFSFYDEKSHKSWEKNDEQ